MSKAVSGLVVDPGNSSAIVESRCSDGIENIATVPHDGQKEGDEDSQHGICCVDTIATKSCRELVIAGHERTDAQKGQTCTLDGNKDEGNTTCKPAAPVQHGNGSIKRSWLIDTGCPFDLIPARDLQEDDFVVDNDDGIVLATANGPVEVSKAVHPNI